MFPTDQTMRFSVSHLTAVILLAGFVAKPAAGQSKPEYVFPDGVEVYFLSVNDAAQAIVEDGPDPFFERLTLLDIELRVGRKLESTDLTQEQAGFREFVRRTVREWTPDDRKTLLPLLESIHAKCASVLPSLIPKKWRFIKTAGDEGAPHTRGPCIVLPQSFVAAGPTERTLIHETFHVFSRYHPHKRDELYRTIGFRHLRNLSLPIFSSSSIRSRWSLMI